MNEAEAEVTASYTNDDLGERAASVIVDGELAGNEQVTTWNSVGAPQDEYPVKINFDWGENEYNISSLRVMWWADGENVKFPSDCKITEGLPFWNRRLREFKIVLQTESR